MPGETTVETLLSQNQSALRQSSDAYCDMVAEKGWAEADKGLAGFADLLLKGRSSGASAATAYAANIGADSRAPALVLARISSDSEAARLGLDQVTEEARAVLQTRNSNGSNRNDVISYERALVRAQMAHRSFRGAFDSVAARADMDISPVERELDSFAASIDEARRVADLLADHYAGASAAS